MPLVFWDASALGLRYVLSEQDSIVAALETLLFACRQAK